MSRLAKEGQTGKKPPHRDTRHPHDVVGNRRGRRDNGKKEWDCSSSPHVGIIPNYRPTVLTEIARVFAGDPSLGCSFTTSSTEKIGYGQFASLHVVQKELCERLRSCLNGMRHVLCRFAVLAPDHPG